MQQETLAISSDTNLSVLDGAYPLQSMVPDVSYFEENVWRKRDRSWGVFFRQRTLESSLNGWTWNLLFLIFLPYAIVTRMLVYISLKGSQFWKDTANYYSSFRYANLVGFYQGFDDHLGGEVYGFVSANRNSWSLRLLNVKTQNVEMRIDFGHWRQDAEKQSKETNKCKKHFILMQNLGKENLYIQFASFHNGILSIDARPEKTRFPQRPSLPSVQLQKCSKTKTIVLLISYTMSLLINHACIYSTIFARDCEAKTVYDEIVSALNYSAAATSPILKIHDAVHDTALMTYVAGEDTNIAIARELALDGEDNNKRGTIGNAYHLAVHDMTITSKPSENQTSSE